VAQNWRTIQLNQECWLMLLGFSLDYWNNEHIQSALASFGHMLMWENDWDHLARLMVRARVSDLQDVPYFLVLIEAEGFQGESWMVQVEIVEQEMLGALSADEDPILVPQVQDNTLPFDFFGLGQQVLPPVQQNNQNWAHNAYGE
jgi:hypothetical protein